MELMNREEAEAAAERELLRAREESRDWVYTAHWMKTALGLALEGRYTPQPNKKLENPK